MMRILIADEAATASKALRPFFKTKGGKQRGKAATKMAGKAQAGQLMVACPPRRTSGPDDCACPGLDLGDQPEQASAVLDALGISLLNRGCLDEGAALIAQALVIRLRFFGSNHPITALSRNSSARAHRELGKLEESLDEINKAIRINSCAYGAKSLPIAINLVERGVCQLQKGRFRAAHKDATEGLDILTDLGLYDTDPNTTRLLDIRGRAELNLREPDDAQATYRELLAIDLKQLGTKNHPKYATHLANEAAVKEALNDSIGAEDGYRAAIDLYENGINRPCHPNLIDACIALGSLLRLQNTPAKLREAGDLFKRALDLDLQIRGADHYCVGNDHAHLGRHYYDSGKFDDARKAFREAARIYAATTKNGGLPANHFFVAEAQTWEGRVIVEQGGSPFARAEQVLENAVRIWPSQLGPDTPGEAIAKACLGRSLYLQQKDPPRALRLLQEAYPLILAALGADHAFTLRAAQWLQEASGSGTPTPRGRFSSKSRRR